MKTRLTILVCALCAAFPSLTHAQATESGLEQDFGGRVSVELDKKLSKGLHVNLSGQARFQDNFSSFSRYYAGLGVTYKFNSWLKAGAGYNFIENKKSSGEWGVRHRAFADLTGTVKGGDWTFSLKERLQLTHRDVTNPWQDNPNALVLRSRLKAEYGGFGSLTPYAYTELRLALNDPLCIATWNGASYSDYQFGGYSDCYLNRVRGVVGLEYEFDKRNSLDLYLIGDYTYDKNIDVNKEGTKLKSLTYDRAFNVNIGVGYKFSF